MMIIDEVVMNEDKYYVNNYKNDKLLGLYITGHDGSRKSNFLFAVKLSNFMKNAYEELKWG